MSIAIWEKLKRRINMAYYVGEKDVSELDDYINGISSDKPVVEIGIDVDDDGVVDKKVSLKKG